VSEQPLSNEVALRIALAARALPGVSVGELIETLQTYLGDELNEESLSRITVTQLKTGLGQTYSLDGEEDGEDSVIELSIIKDAVKILWGEANDVEASLPTVEPYQDGDITDSIRVAVASNSHEQLDGHFGSCLRYLIYQLSAKEMKLIDIRSTVDADKSDDKNAFRVQLIKDCHVLYVVSVGGPAAAKVIKGGIYPMKASEGGLAREVLSKLQNAIATSPPPWLAKVLGVAASERVKNYKAVGVG
jgi:nitrogen fixation protein NifX